MRRFALPTLVLVSLVVTLALSACSKPITPLSASSAQGIASMVGSSDGMVLGMLEPTSSYAPLSVGSPVVAAAGIAPLVAGPCSTTSGWSQNADADLAPANASIQYQDCSTGGITASGSFTIQDNNDTVPYDGFRAALSGFHLSIVGTSSTVTLAASGSLAVDRTKAPPQPAFAITYTFDESIRASGLDGSAHISGKPTLASSVTSGNPYHTGTFTLDGTASFDVNGYSYQLTRTGTGIVGAGCSGFAVDTSVSPARVSDITYTDGPGNTLELVYSGCQTGTWTFTPAGGGASSTGTF